MTDHALAEVPKGLTYCSDERPGLRRTATSKGFVYHDTHGGRIKDEKVIDRIHGLAIPPAWTDVWICPRASGHIQATGRDVKGRKQYRYHNDWSSHASETKFERLPAFARALPRLRKQVEADLNKRGSSKEKVLAHYADVSGRQVDDMDYYVILARWKLAVVLEQGFQRAGDDVKLQAFGPVVLGLMREAAELAETTDYS